MFDKTDVLLFIEEQFSGHCEGAHNIRLMCTYGLVLRPWSTFLNGLLEPLTKFRVLDIVGCNVADSCPSISSLRYSQGKFRVRIPKSNDLTKPLSNGP